METKSKYSKYYPIFSFVLAAMSMYILMAYVGYLSTGDYCIINGDLKDNYIPAIRNLCRDIMNGESIFYTWTYGMGMNTSLYNAYYCYSPLNLIYLPFYNGDMNTVTVAVIIIKTGLAALLFQVFANKACGSNGVESVIFSVFYSMCSFQIAFNVQNIIWLDAMIALPLVFLFINRLVKMEKWIGLTLSYAFIFISQFYMGYMIGIASVMYFAICVVLEKDINRAKIKQLLWKYVMAVGFAIGISAWVWVPTLFFMSGNTYVVTGKFEILNANVFDIVNQCFWGEVSNYDAIFPYVYCGIPSLVLSISFFCNKRRRTKEKICYGIVLLIMLLSCMLSPLYVLWHGFDEPNSYAYRFSYIISFFLCMLAVKEISLAKENGKIRFLIIGVGLCVIYIGEMMWQKKTLDELFQSNKWESFCINLLLILLWILGVWIFDSGKKYYAEVAFALVFLASLESITNGYHILQYGDKISVKLTNEGYYTWDMCEKWAVNEFDKDNSLYRVCYWQGLSPSAGINYGYNGISYFGSADNLRLRSVLGRMGFFQSPRIVCDYGITPVTKMLLGVKYDAFGEKQVEREDGTIGYTVGLEQNYRALGMGYMVEGNVEDYSNFSTNPFENSNMLLSAMTGNDIDAFEPIQGQIISITGKGLKLSNDGEGYLLEYAEEANNPDEDVYLDFAVPLDDQCYAYVENNQSVYASDTYILEGGEENNAVHYGRLSVSYIKELERCDEGAHMRIVSDGFCGNESFDDLYFYKYNDVAVEYTFEQLKDSQLCIYEYCDGHIKGKVDVTDDKHILFTSIPYEKGWRAYVNGKEYPISPIIYDSFIAIELPGPGNYEVELTFRAPGARLGIVFSLISVFVSVFVNVMSRNPKYWRK